MAILSITKFCRDFFFFGIATYALHECVYDVVGLLHDRQTAKLSGYNNYGTHFNRMYCWSVLFTAIPTPRLHYARVPLIPPINSDSC